MKWIVFVAMATASSSSLAQWECTRPDGSQYQTSQRPSDDKCEPALGADGMHPSEKPATHTAPRKPFKSNPKEAKAALASGKASIRAGLKDPLSAQFRGVFVKRDLYVCGEVNAKNSYGGYVGYQRFIALAGIPSLDRLDDGSQDFLRQWAQSCSDLTKEQIDQVMGATD